MQYENEGGVCVAQAHRPTTDRQRRDFQTQTKKDHLKVAAYARYSTDNQKETSIDDQIMVCRETAARHGLVVSDDLIFTDAAITGAQKGTKKREKYHAMRACLVSGKIDVIISDQTCRLARHATESMGFFDDLKAHKVRLLTADGFDSEQPTAQLLFGIKSVFSEFFLDETRHRVRRGMRGMVGRGGMVTTPPFGYQVDLLASDKAGYCVWHIVPEQAEIIRELFSLRKAGKSITDLALMLNTRRVATHNDQDGAQGLYWHAGVVWRVLRNPIYKGLYLVNFAEEGGSDQSAFQRLMPELAIVNADIWAACNDERNNVASNAGTQKPKGRPKGSRRGQYGSGKHAFAGLFHCGACGAVLTCHEGKNDSGSLHCVQCEHARAAGVPNRKPEYVSIKGASVMLRWLLERIVTGDVLATFRERLKIRLEGGHENDLAAARASLQKGERVKDRLLRLLGSIDIDDPGLEQQYSQAREDVLRLSRKVQEIEAGLLDANREAIEKQLNIELGPVIDAFLGDTETPERTRAILRRIFPRMLLLGKTDRFNAYFEIAVKPGAILAAASETSILDQEEAVILLHLNTSGSKYPVWTLAELNRSELPFKP